MIPWPASPPRAAGGRRPNASTRLAAAAASWLLRGSAVASLLLLLLHGPAASASDAWRRGRRSGCGEAAEAAGCYCSESAAAAAGAGAGDGLTVRCSDAGLAAVPPGLPNDTRRLYLDGNLLASLPPDAFAGLPLLAELDLSRNRLSGLEPGSFRGLAASLRSLDLSSNRLTTLEPAALGGLRARANLSLNPWHCDCHLQVAVPQLDLEPASLAGVVCHSAEPDAAAAGAAVRGVALVMLEAELDLCAAARRRTTDVAMLVTMFGWFAAVIAYLVYYVRHNQEDTRRHLEYLKSLPCRQASALSTVV